MSVAAIYDIHANLPALQAVLAELRSARVERLVVGGDVLPGPMPCETLAALFDLEIPVQFIQGNGDRAVVEEAQGVDSGALPEAARDVVRWVARRLPPESLRRVAVWPKSLRAAVPGLGDVLFCHATPRSDTEIFTRLTPPERVLPALLEIDAATVVCGHTHMQFDRRIGSIRVVNAGSVGMPYGQPGAHWLLLGPEIEFRRTPYDFAAAAARIQASEYPQAEDFATHAIVQPRSESEMLATFAKISM